MNTLLILKGNYGNKELRQTFYVFCYFHLCPDILGRIENGKRRRKIGEMAVLFGAKIDHPFFIQHATFIQATILSLLTVFLSIDRNHNEVFECLINSSIMHRHYLGLFRHAESMLMAEHPVSVCSSACVQADTWEIARGGR